MRRRVLRSRATSPLLLGSRGSSTNRTKRIGRGWTWPFGKPRTSPFGKPRTSPFGKLRTSPFGKLRTSPFGKLRTSPRLRGSM
ncbi:MAG: hypothetical protein ISS78_05795 [Phycisphaerae bacterium]|nr:hypothetical protein [Phycisphaerae bacterium]